MFSSPFIECLTSWDKKKSQDDIKNLKLIKLPIPWCL